MADPADRAEVEEFVTTAAIQNIRSRGRELYPIGSCHYCYTEFESSDSPKLFCDANCGIRHEQSK